MNDFTVPDIVVGRKGFAEDVWIPVQLKTTSEPRGGTRWRFAEVAGYNDMLVVCVCVKDMRIWSFDGSVLHDFVSRKKNNDICISDGGSVSRLGKSHGPGHGAIQSLSRHIDALFTARRYPLVTETEARWMFNQPNHFLEMWTIDLYTNVFSDDHVSIQWPDEPSAAYDVLLIYPGKMPQRAQFKFVKEISRLSGGGCSAQKSKAGFQCNLTKSKGGRKKGPYNKGDFDVLVAVHIDTKSAMAHFWTIDSSVIFKDSDVSLFTMVLHVAHNDATRCGYRLPNSDGIGRPNHSLWTRSVCHSVPLYESDMPPVPFPESLKEVRWN
jgi:hypothetical protein